MFGSVVVNAFQITFRAKIHANDVFLFFKNYFWHQHIKTIQNVQTILNFSKNKKKFKFQTLPTSTTPCISLVLHCWMSAKMAGKKTFEKRACHLQILFLAISLREQRTRIDMDRCLTASSNKINRTALKIYPFITISLTCLQKKSSYLVEIASINA